jgi:hypothetical protein
MSVQSFAGDLLSPARELSTGHHDTASKAAYGGQGSSAATGRERSTGEWVAGRIGLRSLRRNRLEVPRSGARSVMTCVRRTDGRLFPRGAAR